MTQPDLWRREPALGEVVALRARSSGLTLPLTTYWLSGSICLVPAAAAGVAAEAARPTAAQAARANLRMCMNFLPGDLADPISDVARPEPMRARSLPAVRLR